MKKLLTILFCLSLLLGSSGAWGQISESFETGLPTSYTTDTEYVLSSGTWTGSPSQVIRGTSGVNTGSYSCQLRSQTGAQITTPTLEGGVGTISFYVTASTALGGLQIRISEDNGDNWTQVSGSPISFGTTTELQTFEVNDPNVNKVQFYRTGSTVYIDDVEITQTNVELPTSGVVFISEVADANTIEAQYLELFNNSVNPINLSTSKLVMLNDDGVVQTVWDLSSFSLQNIPPFGFFIITRGGTLANFVGEFGTINENTVFVEGSGGMFFGASTSRRWQLWEGGTPNTADGSLIDDTEAAVAGNNNRTYQNIFNGTFTTDARANATPGELDYLVYNGGQWVNSEALGAATGSEDALIYDDLSIATNVAANDIYINDGVTVTLNAGMEMDVNGSLTNNAGSLLILQSPENSNAAASLIVDTYSGTGEIRAERYIAGYTSPTDGWHLFASPVNNFVVAGSDFEPSSTLGQEDDLYYWNEAQSTAGLWMNWKEAAFNFEAGKGYLLAFKNSGKRNIQGIPYNAGVALSNLSYTNPSGGSTYHLLGNHFTSALSWTVANWDRTAVGGVAKVMNVSNGSYLDVNDGGIIPAMQGFFVEVTNGTNAITIPKAAQIHSAQAWYKSSSTDKILLQATDIENDLSQQNVIIFNPETDGSYNPVYDGRFLPLYAPALYTVKDGRKLSTNSLPAPDEDQGIPLNFESNGATQFLIELVDAPVQYTVYLTDQMLGYEHNLSETPTYQFNAAEGDNPNRFLIHFGALSLNEQGAGSSIGAYVHNKQLYVLNANGQTQLGIFDLQGRLLQSSSFKANGLHTQAIELPAGIYVIRVMDEKGVRTVKVVVE